MKIEELPSGSYRVRKQFEGQRITVILPYKPTQKEALQLIIDKAEKPQDKHTRLTFEQAYNNYVESKSNIIEPYTYIQYKGKADSFPEWFRKTPLTDIDQETVQKCINELAKTLKPYTVRGLKSLACSTIYYYRPDVALKIQLPKNKNADIFIPTKEEVKILLDYTKGTKYYIPLALASHGLRMSEIIGLSIDDLSEDNMIHIHSAKVLNAEYRYYVRPATKTISSDRYIPIAPDLADAIRQKGYIYNETPATLYKWLKRIEKKLGISDFSIHKLRHFYASTLLAEGVPIKDVQKLGGWSNANTLLKIYAHAMKSKTKEGQKEISQKLWSGLFS